MWGRVIQSSSRPTMRSCAGCTYAAASFTTIRRDGMVRRTGPLVIRRNDETGEVSLNPLRRGLIPYWCEDEKGGRKPINAKRETVNPASFREAYHERRCIPPVDGFFEWKAIKGQKATHR